MIDCRICHKFSDKWNDTRYIVSWLLLRWKICPSGSAVLPFRENPTWPKVILYPSEMNPVFPPVSAVQADVYRRLRHIYDYYVHISERCLPENRWGVFFQTGNSAGKSGRSWLMIPMSSEVFRKRSSFPGVLPEEIFISRNSSFSGIFFIRVSAHFRYCVFSDDRIFQTRHRNNLLFKNDQMWLRLFFALWRSQSRGFSSLIINNIMRIRNTVFITVYR